MGDIAHARITRGCQNQEISNHGEDRDRRAGPKRKKKAKQTRVVQWRYNELLLATQSVFSDVLSADDDLFFQVSYFFQREISTLSCKDIRTYGIILA